MLFGLAGAHGTGKTTLAEAYSQESGMPFLHFDTREVMKKAGVSKTSIKDIRERMRVQRLIVERCDELFNRSRTPRITDRTPIDVAAYTIADITQHCDADKWVQDEAQAIINDCIDLMNLSFMCALVVPPAIPYVAEPGRPAPNLAYQEHHHLLVCGLLSDERAKTPWWLINRDHAGIDQRVEIAINIWDNMTEDSQLESEVMVHH